MLLRRFLVGSVACAASVLVLGSLALAYKPAKRGALPPVKALAAPRDSLAALNPQTLLSFMVLFGGMGSRTHALQDGADMPTVWRNDLRQPFTVHTIVCKTASGQADILPVLEPGGLTSMLTHVCPCRPSAWALCAVNGFPVIHPFADDGATCPTPPCEFGILVPKGGGALGLRVSITGPLAP